MATGSEGSVFKTLNADDVDHTVTEIESCCMNCYENVSILPLEMFCVEIFPSESKRMC